MTIKEASKLTGVSIDNLRYYGRIGLIPPVPRTKSGSRDYDEISIRWIEFIKKFKKKFFTLKLYYIVFKMSIAFVQILYILTNSAICTNIILLLIWKKTKVLLKICRFCDIIIFNICRNSAIT